MKKNNKLHVSFRLNGSVQRLAGALKDVFTEAVTEAVQPISADVKLLRKETREGFIQVNQTLQEHGRRLGNLEKKL